MPNSVVTPQFALVVFMIIILISLSMAWFFSDFDTFNHGRFHTFIAILAGLGVIVTFMFYYGVVSLQQQQQQLFVIQETARLSNIIMEGIFSELNKSSVLIPNFVHSINPLLNCTNTTNSDPDTIDACVEKITLSYRLFSVWQDVIISNSFIDYEPRAYITSFLQWANSKELYKLWNDHNINFNSKTVDFGNLLFEYAIPITLQIPQSYVTAADNLMKDSRYKLMFHI
jgi:hypothetical protein